MSEHQTLKIKTLTHYTKDRKVLNDTHTEEKAQRNLPMRTAAYFVLHVFNNKKTYDNKKHKNMFLNIYEKT